MNGLEPLRALESTFEQMGEECATVTVDGEPLCDVLHRIADQLEREQTAAIEWVEEHGGLEEVRQNLVAVRMIAKKLGMEDSSAFDVSKEACRRLMPEGMEWLLEVWPKWSNGEYCKFGDWWKAGKYGEREPQQLRRLVFFTPEQLREWGQDEGENFGYEWDYMRPSDTTYRPDKVEPPAPKVLDADGVVIEVGDDLYSVKSGRKFHVGCIDTRNGKIATAAMFAIDEWDDPLRYTHRAPVLAADGKPLREGETVWSTDSGTRYTVEKVTDELIPIKCRSEMGSTVSLHPSQLTHERPDSWELLEEDATKLSPHYYARDVMGLDTDKMPPKESRRVDMMRDLVRRAKKLAGVE